MTLKKLEITLKEWGDNEGKYEVEIQVRESHNEIKMVLPPELGDAMVAQAKDLIHKFSVRAADRLRDDLILATPKQIEV